MQESHTGNVNSTYFEGYYKEIWRRLIPEALTHAEVEFLINYCSLKPGSMVLDLMCGYGRHALALGRKGIRVTAIDNLADYINEVKEQIVKEELPVTVFQADVIEFQPQGLFDLVICLGNNLSFFDEQETRKLFSTIAAHLIPGGLFIANTWTLAETAFRKFSEKASSDVGGLKFSTDSKIFFHPTRIETTTTIETPDGESEMKTAVDYIYTLFETEDLLRQAGFTVKVVYSIPGKKKFTLGEPRAYIIAVKN